MNTDRLIRHLFAVGLVIGGCLALTSASAADLYGNADISRAWSRLDLPVESGMATRTWFWGPKPITDLHTEPYADAPGGSRLVIYFDKTRMEINDNVAPGSAWRVTNGLLATELVTGRVQLGDNTFDDASPPEINVAGDPDDPDAPTYRTFSGLTDADALPEGALITQAIARDGSVTSDSAYGGYGVTAKRYVPETGHTVASVFWDFLTSEGTIYVSGDYQTGLLIEDQVYGVGYPITEAYWTRVRVAGEDRPVLIQAFQRRVMTYTPDNPDGWKVETGNVGQHYRDWRASLGDLTSQPDSDPPASEDNDTDNGPSTTETNNSKPSNRQSDDCNGESVNVSNNGTVKQSNSATINQSGGGNNTVKCTQKNVNVQKD